MSITYQTHMNPSHVARFMHNPTKKHMGITKRVLRYIQGTVNYGIAYKKGKCAVLIGYCDRVFSWASIKQSSVALSTIEAEYVGAVVATAQAIWLRFVLYDLGKSKQNQLSCCVIILQPLPYQRI
ncbi:unnamed protein product [Prunus armeniaca]